MQRHRVGQVIAAAPGPGPNFTIFGITINSYQCPSNPDKLTGTETMNGVTLTYGHSNYSGNAGNAPVIGHGMRSDVTGPGETVTFGSAASASIS